MSPLGEAFTRLLPGCPFELLRPCAAEMLGKATGVCSVCSLPQPDKVSGDSLRWGSGLFCGSHHEEDEKPSAMRGPRRSLTSVQGGEPILSVPLRRTFSQALIAAPPVQLAT